MQLNECWWKKFELEIVCDGELWGTKLKKLRWIQCASLMILINGHSVFAFCIHWNVIDRYHHLNPVTHFHLTCRVDRNYNIWPNICLVYHHGPFEKCTNKRGPKNKTRLDLLKEKKEKETFQKTQELFTVFAFFSFPFFAKPCHFLDHFNLWSDIFGCCFSSFFLLLPKRKIVQQENKWRAYPGATFRWLSINFQRKTSSFSHYNL